MAGNTPIITLTTDFGSRDPFVGIMKAVILSIHPPARIVDITHEVERHNVEEALYTLDYAHRYFPAGTIHVVVIDPGVGTQRRPLLVEEDKSLFLSPDNGALSFLFHQDPGCAVRVIESDHYFLKPVSRTFHGRDVFAPVAAWLARGIRPEHVGPEVSDYTRLNIPQLLISEEAIRGEIIHEDRFGNLVTNVGRRHLETLRSAGGTLVAESRGVRIQGLYTAYAENTSGGPGMIVNSFDLLEFFCYRASARDKTGLKRGDRVQVTGEAPPRTA